MKLAALCITYNRPHLLGELIQCFLAQDYPKELRELIILDDAGQYDNQEGNGWRLISIPRRFHTLGEKRNACAALASPDVEGFLVADDDDIYLPHWFSACARALKEGEFCRPGLVLTLEGDKFVAKSAAGGVFHPGWAYRKSAFYRVGGYRDINAGEDQDFGRRLLASGVKVVDPCQYYPPYLYYRWDISNTYHATSASYDALGRMKIEKCHRIEIKWSKPWSKLPIILPGGQRINQPTIRDVHAYHVSAGPKRVDLIRPILHPDNSGPIMGMYALQKLLRRKIESGLKWLSIVTNPSSKQVLPWFWWVGDRDKASKWIDLGLPFVQGPNTLFIHARTPRIDSLECKLLDSSLCKMTFCHSEWYRDLILKQRGPENTSPIVLWPYPVDVWPEGPLPPEYDLLIYVKNFVPPGLPEFLAERFPNSKIIQYGHYQREELFEIARRSRACAYLAEDESGGIATAEIFLSGCPIVGVKTGAPFIIDGLTGLFVEKLPNPSPQNDEQKELLGDYLFAIRKAQEFDRKTVRDAAAEKFDNEKIVKTILDALELARSS